MLRRHEDTNTPVLLPEYTYTPKADLEYVTPGYNTINYDSTGLEMIDRRKMPEPVKIQDFNSKKSEPARFSPNDIITAIDGLSNRSHVTSTGAVYQLDVEVSREVTDTYFIDLKHGNGSAGLGIPRNCKPDCVISLSEEDMVDLFTRQLSATMAFMQGRLRVSGNMGAAMKLETFLSSLTDRVV